MADDEYRTFRSLVDSADRKFCKVQSLPPHSRGPHHSLLYRKAFRAYTRLWRFQLDRRRPLLAAGLRRREIGEVASRIGQLYYSQYLRTSEARFLVESYVFYEAILSRGYFEAEGEGAPPDLGLRCKELRFHARFLVVAMLLGRRWRGIWRRGSGGYWRTARSLFRGQILKNGSKCCKKLSGF